MMLKDKIIISNGQLVNAMAQNHMAPLNITCAICKSHQWHLFIEPYTRKLMAACAKCERPVELKLYLTA